MYSSCCIIEEKRDSPLSRKRQAMGRILARKPYRVISGIGAGAGAALAMLLAMAGLRYAFQLPTIPELMLNPIVRAMGGQRFSDALDNLYFAGRPLLFTTILEGTLLLGALLGLLYAWLARPNSQGRRLPIFNNPLGGIAYGLLIGVLLNLVFLPLVDQPAFADQPYGIFSASTIPLWVGLMVLALIFGVTVHGLLIKVPAAPVAVQPAEGEDAASVGPASPDRRQLLRIASGTLLALIGGGIFIYGGTLMNQDGQSVTNRPLVDEEPVVEDTPTPVRVAQAPPTNTPEPPPPTNTPEPPPTIEEATAAPPTNTAPQPTNTPEVVVEAPTATPTVGAAGEIKISLKEMTPNKSFYHISKNFFDPSPSSDGWKLEIKGLVADPYSLTYDELTALPAIEVVTGMMCISNPVGGGLIGSTKWKGVRLADLLKRANPKKGVVDIKMTAVDGYTDSITYKKALDPDVVLVWEMGGETLTATHGFPARLLVPGIYGMKHVKWITSIELVNHDFKGYWQEPSQGWSDPAPVHTMSRIDLPIDGLITANKKQVIQGVAFAGNRSISKVEVSTDGGKTWNPAYVKPPLSNTSWVVWGFEWTPTKPGKYVVQVRATDGTGKLQTAKKADPYPSGATGYHTVTYSVKAASGQAPTNEEMMGTGIKEPSSVFMQPPLEKRAQEQ